MPVDPAQLYVRGLDEAGHSVKLELAWQSNAGVVTWHVLSEEPVHYVLLGTDSEDLAPESLLSVRTDFNEPVTSWGVIKAGYR